MATFNNSYAQLPDRFYTRLAPTPVAAPEMVLWNADLARDLGVEDWDAAILSGNKVPLGAAPLAQVYAGHQFGGWVPRLGDGRAILLGEIDSPTGHVDIVLKGAGRTPYSRNGDGRAWLGPVLREYLISEFMAACGVPTTRALAAVATGERVQRERAYPGGILTRVAASHIRVGTFQYFTAQGDDAAVEALTDHVRARHYPHTDSALSLFAAIVQAQAELVAKWATLGFVHGVMNTDNMAVSGETIDYGPCAFIDRFDPHAVYSSIDHHGRYAYDKQPDMAGWNLAQLGSCLVAQVTKDLGAQDTAIEGLTQALNRFPALYAQAWLEGFGAKIGIDHPQEDDRRLVQDLLDIMAAQSADFTNVFRLLGTQTAREEFTDPAPFEVWERRWVARLGGAGDETADESGDAGAMAAARARMAQINPQVIPRTHQIEAAIDAAVDGDFAPVQRLAQVWARPLNVDTGNADLMRPPTRDEMVPNTFCGT